VRQSSGRLVGTFWDRRTTPRKRAAGGNGVQWVERGAGGASVAAGSVLEMALPLADLNVTAGQPVAFFVAIYESETGAEIERHPEYRPIELVAPDEMFEARYWRA
jgi:hypothetical protein